MQLLEENELYRTLGRIGYLRVQAGLSTSERENRDHYFSALAGKVTFLTSPFNTVVGYICWASIDRDSYRQLRDRRLWPRYFHEWTEGAVTLVTDTLILPEWRGSLTAQLLALRKRHRATVLHYRNKNVLLCRTRRAAGETL